MTLDDDSHSVKMLSIERYLDAGVALDALDALDDIETMSRRCQDDVDSETMLMTPDDDS